MRRELLARLLPVALLGLLAVSYVMVRPSLAARNPYLTIWEYPIGAAVVALLLWLAMRRRRPEAPPQPWRRHAQVVRPLPDPALAPLVGTLERWVETGETPDAAADVLARARTNDPGERESLARRFTEELATKTTRRSRRSHLKTHLTHLET